MAMIATGAPQATIAPVFPVMELPAELREMCYVEYILDRGAHYQIKTTRVDYYAGDRATMRKMCSPLSATSKQIHDEFEACEQKLLNRDGLLHRHFYFIPSDRHNRHISGDYKHFTPSALSVLNKVRTCTLVFRQGWHDYVLDCIGLVGFIDILQNAVEVCVDVICPSDTPLYEAWVAATKTLKESLRARMANENIGRYLHTRLRASLAKVSVVLHSTYDGDRCRFYVGQWERGIRRTDGLMKWLRTIPRAEAGEVPIRQEWDQEKMIWRCEHDEWCLTDCLVLDWEKLSGPLPKDERFEW